MDPNELPIPDEPLPDEPLPDEPLLDEPLLDEPIFDDEEPLNISPIIMPIPISLSQLLNSPSMNSAIDSENTLEQEIQHRSFHEQNKYKQVCTKDFINSLSVQNVTPEMVSSNLTCGICLEELQVGQNVIELPCKDKHYFHIQTSECGGIYPWLKENNSCPMCRHQFPSEEKEMETSEPEPMEPPQITPINLMNIVNQAIRDQEERMLQETIMASLLSSD